MSSFYTRIKLGGRLAEAEAGRQAGRQAGGRRAHSGKHTMGLQDGYGNRVVVTGKWTDPDGGTDGRTEQEDEEGGKEEERG